jgi:hypothetical protein
LEVQVAKVEFVVVRVGKEHGWDVNKAAVNLCHNMAVNIPVNRKELGIVVGKDVLEFIEKFQQTYQLR